MVDGTVKELINVLSSLVDNSPSKTRITLRFQHDSVTSSYQLDVFGILSFILLT